MFNQPKLRGYNRSRHGFCVTYLALPIFTMVNRFQKVITEAENCYNLAAYMLLWFSFGLITFNFTREHMDFSFSYPG